MRSVMISKKYLLLAVLGMAIIAGFFISDHSDLTAQTGEIHWLYNIDSALIVAKQQNKSVMIDFMAVWCPPCKAMEDTTFSNPEVISKSALFITVRIDVDEQAEIADKYNGNARKYGGVGIPNILFLTPDNQPLKHIIGFQSPDQLIAVMDSVLAGK